MSREKKQVLLHLPKTNFPMKAGLAKKEPELIQFWQKNRVYHKLIQKRESQNRFHFLDGPVYANGRLHVGHALNKILKDITVKYRNLAKECCPFQPTWDCHGLPLEMEVFKKLGEKQPTGESIRKLCRQAALHWVKVQREQFERLGVLADWENPLLTLDPEYEAEQVRALAKMVDKNLLYRGKKPVFWCPVLQTAVANSEVEYHSHKSPSIYVKFPAPDIKHFLSLKSQKPCSFVIWTTTPWTLVANQAVCLKPDLLYGVFDAGDDLLIIAEQLKTELEKITGLRLKKLTSIPGRKLERQIARHPWLKRDSLVILGDHVGAKEGTGCVHTAPGHGQEDFVVGMKYKLPVLAPVNEAGQFTSEVTEWKGMHIWKANPHIINKLKERQKLLHSTTITHNYPHHPRSHSPLILRAVEQWFIAMDHPQYSIRKIAKAAIESQIQFIPAWGKNRLLSMIEHSPDWCLSRQRYWGVPIPVFYCRQCQSPLLSATLMRHLADRMEKSGTGIEYWFSHTAEELLGQKVPICHQCKNQTWDKGKDILDVWFDSGICHALFQKKYHFFPADLYLEGSDQHRGWFQTSLNTSIALTGKSPFKTLITHGFINDPEGKKMSKSKKNVVDLETLIKERGADIVRLWVLSEDYAEDSQISPEIIERVTETYRRFRNTFRFMLGNLFDFNPGRDLMDFSEMEMTDQWVLGRFKKLITEVQSCYDRFLYYKIYQALGVFFTNILSSLYLDILKDRLYTFKADSKGRRSAQSAIYLMSKNLSTVMSPVVTFLSEEVYQHLPGKKDSSVLLTDFPCPPKAWEQPPLEKTICKLALYPKKISMPKWNRCEKRNKLAPAWRQKCA